MTPTLLKGKFVYGRWLRERCRACGGNVFISYDELEGNYSRECLQCSRKRDLENNKAKPLKSIRGWYR